MALRFGAKAVASQSDTAHSKAEQLHAAVCGSKVHRQWQRLESGGPGQLSLRQPRHLSASQSACYS